jgi:ATP-binding cassette subfamily C protein CydD
MEATKAEARQWSAAQTKLGRRAASYVILPSLLGTLLGVGAAYLLATILGAYLAGNAVSPLLIAEFAGLALARAALMYLADISAQRAGAQARRRLRTESLTRLLEAGPSLLRGHHSGELAAIVVDKIEALDGFFARWIPASQLAVLGPITVGIFALLTNKFAGLTLFGAGLFVPFAMAIAGIGAGVAAKRQVIAMTRVQSRFLDRVRGIATIVLAGQTQSEAASLRAAATDLSRRTMRVLRVAFLSSAALDLAAAFALVLIAIHFGGLLRRGDLFDPQPALFCLFLVPEFFAPLRAFAAAYQDRLHAAGSADALAALPPAPAPSSVLPIRNVPAHGITIAFENVHFAWDEARGPVLDGVSFRAPPGEVTLLVGTSGSGKSTILEMLLGFIRPQQGRVTINGADIADLVPEALSRLTAWIGQRPVIFAGSIADNIKFARPDATPAEIRHAGHLALVDRFADGLPDGFDTEIGEGGFGLSGGQAQRIAIARAFLKNAPLLLLDEPTSHLDPATEGEVLDSLRRLVLGRTVILASHATAAHVLGGRRIELVDGKASLTRGAA